MTVVQGVEQQTMIKTSEVTPSSNLTFGSLSQLGTRSWFALGLIITAQYAGALNAAILTISMESFKIELGLTDLHIGLFLSFPFICAGAGGLILGYLADRAPRQIVLSACIFFWSIATIGLGMAIQFFVILLGIVALAFGEQALGPVVNSMVPDLFSKKSRVKVNLILAGTATVAGGLGAIAAGNLIAFVDFNLISLKEYFPVSSGVRGAFVIAGLLGLPIAILVLFIGNIKRQNHNFKDAPNFRIYMNQHGTALIGLYSAFAIQAAGISAIASWIPTYLARRFEMSAADVGTTFGKAVIAGSVLGIAFSLVLTQLLSPKFGQRTSYIIYLSGMVIAIIPTLMQLIAYNLNMVLYCVFISVALLTMGGGLTSTMLQDVSPSQLRGRLFSGLVLFMSLIPSVSPSLVGIISDLNTDSKFGLIQSICSVSVSCFLLSSLVLYKCRKAINTSINFHNPAK